MPVLIHRTFASIHFWATGIILWATTLSIPVLHGSLIMDAESFTPTSDLNFERIPFCRTPRNQSDPVDPQLWWFTKELWRIYVPDSGSLWLMFSNTHMIIPLQDISVRWRHYIKFGCTITARLWSFSKTTANHGTICSMPNLCATNLTDSSNSFPILAKPWNSISWFHREAPPSSSYTSILVIVIASQISHLHSDSWHHYVPTTCTTIRLHVFSKHGVPSHVLPIMA